MLLPWYTTTDGIGQEIAAELQHRIMIMDGGMGTMIQSYKLQEDDFRGTFVTVHVANVHVCSMEGPSLADQSAPLAAFNSTCRERLSLYTILGPCIQLLVAISALWVITQGSKKRGNVDWRKTLLVLF